MPRLSTASSFVLSLRRAPKSRGGVRAWWRGASPMRGGRAQTAWEPPKTVAVVQVNVVLGYLGACSPWLTT
eukprot:3118475-Rhodomonas_salina.1